MKCRLMRYDNMSDLEPWKDNDGYNCPFRVDGECSLPNEELGIEFNLSGVVWCIPRSEHRMKQIKS